MKKIVLALILIGTIAFSEKLTTDRKLNIDKLLGYWANSDILILEKNGKYYLRYFTNMKPDGYSKPYILNKINDYTLKAVDNDGDSYCYAYDTKYKKLASLKCGTETIEKIIPRRQNTFGG